MAREDEDIMVAPDNRADGIGGDAGRATSNDKLKEERDKIEEQILKMEANIFQLANYYFVFQGVILTAVVKGSSSSFKCKYVWLPFCMSVIGTTLNYTTLLIMADKYMELLNAVDTENVNLYQYMYPKTSRMMLLSLLATWIVPCWT
ncbi:hypothetical protein Sango_2243100 [Sesamum angolense]|uniref:Uncharacterized protein n=1 Tax=Sesamum angolense TaxID=2727404 RepID=A0AAE2BKT8_9LAMI|nr:hypothetical protein Sango_2243100 [Sesamum angolense]